MEYLITCLVAFFVPLIVMAIGIPLSYIAITWIIDGFNKPTKKDWGDKS